MPIVSDATGTFPFSRLSPFVSLIPHIWPITPLYAYRMTWKSLQEADLGLLTTCALLNAARVDVIWHNRKANLSHVLSAPRRPVLRGRTGIRFEIWGSCGKLERVCAKCVRSALSWETWKGRLRTFTEIHINRGQMNLSGCIRCDYVLYREASYDDSETSLYFSSLDSFAERILCQ